MTSTMQPFPTRREGESLEDYRDRFPAAGLMCGAHFGRDRTDDQTTMGDLRRCPECMAANEKRAAEIQASETIDPTQEYGQHIALTCVNHQDLRWSTKNIGWIGARSIFYSGRFDGQAECSCSIRDLIVVAS